MAAAPSRARVARRPRAVLPTVRAHVRRRAVGRHRRNGVARLRGGGAARQRRGLMADLSHELRTPVTVLQGKLEGLLDGVYPRDDDQLAALLEETGVLSRLIDDLRTLSLAESGALQLQRESTDIADLARE